MRTGVTRRVTSGRKPGVVYVVTSRTSCNGVTLALRFKDVVYKLDSLVGEIAVVGRKASRRDIIIGNRGPTRGDQDRDPQLPPDQPDRRQRLETSCPGRTYPMGGGMITCPALGARRRGRLPALLRAPRRPAGLAHQRLAVRPDRAEERDAKRTVQAVCGLGLVPESAPTRPSS